MTTLVYILAFVVILILLYFLIVRPWTLTWGATMEEATRPLIGDIIMMSKCMLGIKGRAERAK